MGPFGRMNVREANEGKEIEKRAAMEWCLQGQNPLAATGELKLPPREGRNDL